MQSRLINRLVSTHDELAPLAVRIPVGIIFTAMVIFMPQGLLGFAKRRLNQ